MSDEKVAILNGTPPSHSSLFPILDLLAEKYKRSGFEVEISWPTTWS